jgi:hypothetical protein
LRAFYRLDEVKWKPAFDMEKAGIIEILQNLLQPNFKNSKSLPANECRKGKT